MIVSAGLLAGLPAGPRHGSSVRRRLPVDLVISRRASTTVGASFTGGIFLLSGSIAGLLSRELRTSLPG